MQVTKSVVHDYSAGIKNAVHSEVYTLDMPKFVYVQIHGVERAAKIRADKVEIDQIKLVDNADGSLRLKLGNEQVGEFKIGAIQGWWIEEEPDRKD